MDPMEIEARQRLATLVGEMRSLVDAAEAENRELTPDEEQRYNTAREEAQKVRTRIERMVEVRAAGDDLELPADEARGRGAPGAGGPGGSAGDPDGAPTVDRRSIGLRVVESDELKAHRAGGYKGNMAVDLGPDVSVRALITNDPASPGGISQDPQRLPGIVPAVRDRALRFIDLIPHGDTTDNSIEYVQALGGNEDTAAEVAEGAAKPENDEDLAIVTDPVRTIAVWQDITRQAAEDNGQLMSYLDNRLRYKVRRRLDNQVVNGDGVGVNLLGLLNRPNIQVLAPVAAEKRVITIRRAKTLLEQQEFEGAVTVLNPLDWERFELTTNVDGDFITDPVVRRARAVAEARYAWGTDVAVSNAIAAGTAMVADPLVAMLWDRHEPRAYMTDSDEGKFKMNILTLLLELRAALSLFEPKGIVKVTFNGTD